ncbi:hypothetical protein MRX96_028318 [Rhipicephalus microplus]
MGAWCRGLQKAERGAPPLSSPAPVFIASPYESTCVDYIRWRHAWLWRMYGLHKQHALLGCRVQCHTDVTSQGVGA